MGMLWRLIMLAEGLAQALPAGSPNFIQGAGDLSSAWVLLGQAPEVDPDIKSGARGIFLAQCLAGHPGSMALLSSVLGGYMPGSSKVPLTSHPVV